MFITIIMFCILVFKPACYYCDLTIIMIVILSIIIIIIIIAFYAITIFMVLSVCLNRDRTFYSQFNNQRARYRSRELMEK